MYSQQLSLFNNNIVNPYSLNPATAGLTNNQLFFQHRNELVGIDGAPETSLLTAEFRLPDTKSAIGFQFSHEQANVIKNTSAFATYALHLKLKKEQHLSFGLSFGVRHNGIAFDQVNVIEDGDDVIFDYNQSSTNFDGNFGVNYQFKNLDVQLAGLQLFGGQADYVNSFEQKELNYRFVRHFVGSIGYQFREGEVFKVKPILQVRSVQGLPVKVEGIVRLDYNELIWLAGHYRVESAWALTMGVNINERFTLGYSAEFSTNELAGYNAGTHEILFGVKLNSSSKGGGNPRQTKQQEKRNKSYEERLEYMNQENQKIAEELEKQRARISEIENATNKLNYNEVKQLLDTDKDEKIKQEAAKKLVQSKAKSIAFKNKKSQLSDTSIVALDEIIVVLLENKDSKITVSVSSIDYGNKAKNKKLSEDRANVIKDYLVSKGVEIQRIQMLDKDENSSNLLMELIFGTVTK
jgi:type IX secretion system PorP/SprF family membrane protein